MKEKIEEELSRLTNSGVITQVETSEWATPTVSVKKPNGSVRLCGDYVEAKSRVLSHKGGGSS